MRIFDAASSIRSIALSGKKRSVTYRALSSAAATSALSSIFTVWWASYLSRRPLSISMVSATDGSPTTIGWKRRSNAASFSMFLRYSSKVVAPMHCSSPRARAGFSMFDASIAPSAAPAPTTVCSSSRNKITWPAARRTSSMTPFRRSSNSPRNLEPATIAPMSSANKRRPRRFSGTSPAAILRASPSAMAVLPTPGSPISTGLFFVRRDKI